MTKPLSTLISEACDVEEAAEVWRFQNAIDLPPEIEDAFIAGAAHVAAKLGPALKEAIAMMEDLIENYKMRCGHFESAETLAKIRALLEGGGE